jgi:hypothetical protein
MPKLNQKELSRSIGEKEDGIKLKKPQQIINREDDYRKMRHKKKKKIQESMLPP